MKSLFIILFLISPLAAQTRAELDNKYGPVEGNLYRIKPGIAMDVTFSENDKVQTLRIVPDAPNDKNALLRIEDVRKVVSELVGRRMCRGPLSTSRIDLACPPRKGCFGFKEGWKSLTTLMVRYKQSVVYALMTLEDQPAEPPPGNMKLLPGYEHMPGCGIDTTGGYIKRSGGGIEIHYDIGQMAGNFAKRYANPNVAEWIRTEQVGEDSVLIVLMKQKRIVATFEKSVANFSANVSSQSDIDDFLKMVLTYNPTKGN